MANGAEVDDVALQGGHHSAAHNGHDEEGGTEGGVLCLDILEGYAVDGGEHETHEATDADEAVESAHALDEDGAQTGNSSADAEEHKEAA